MLIAVIDSGIGNVRSLMNALEHIGARPILTRSSNMIRRAAKVIFPGVGAFGTGMKILRKKHLDTLIKQICLDGKPFLGICLGMQLLFESSEEAPHTRGLSIFKGVAKRFRVRKVPHMGWNKVEVMNKTPLFQGLNKNFFTYFVHSYYINAKDKTTLIGRTQYGGQFASVVATGNCYGVQFHPERSGENGLRILENFVKRC